MNDRMYTGILEATRLTRAGHLLAATAAIQRALGGVTVPSAATGTSSPSADTAGTRVPLVIDVVPEAVEITGAQGYSRAQPAAEAPVDEPSAEAEERVTVMPGVSGSFMDFVERLRREGIARGARGLTTPSEPVPAQNPDVVPEGGKFVTASYTNQAGTRAYKLYIPSGYQGQALPLIVMLHGCTQTPDDFAAGTRMNALAEEHPCLVAYPAQASGANVSRCWNWFNAADQQRDQGEPSLIAGITHQVISTYAVDPQRVYIAGLSAGGAMAAIMGVTYPDLYTAIGVHSGLPPAAAHDLPSAFAAMQQGRVANHPPGVPGAVASSAIVPTIVFHGDGDTTVHPCNGEQVVAHWRTIMAATGTNLATQVQRGQAPEGHAYTCTRHQNASGQVILEQWLVHGAGHAWSGGSPNGSYTDPKGPDATQEMRRFFFAHARRPSH